VHDPARPLPPARTRTTSWLLAALTFLGITAGITVGGAVLPAAAYAEDYSAPLRTAVTDLTTASESNSGYDRDLFRHWVDADGDGCSARAEVLISEADDPVGVGSGCSLSGGRWYSYYDGVSVHDSSDVDVDHMVPLAEAWGSGARTWSAATREAYANDLGDYRTLVGVSASSNRSKSDRDPAEWLPAQQVCRYVREWVAVKHRWDLTVDATERSTLVSLADGCTNSTITVTLAR